MQYEVVWVYSQEVVKVFNNEDDAWSYINRMVHCSSDDAELSFEDFDVNYVEKEDPFGDKYFEDPY